ncbi:hypothetical protein U1Q18_029197 [Sarracenia purpurea var. burkii]
MPLLGRGMGLWVDEFWSFAMQNVGVPFLVGGSISLVGLVDGWRMCFHVATAAFASFLPTTVSGFLTSVVGVLEHFGMPFGLPYAKAGFFARESAVWCFLRVWFLLASDFSEFGSSDFTKLGSYGRSLIDAGF